MNCTLSPNALCSYFVPQETTPTSKQTTPTTDVPAATSAKEKLASEFQAPPSEGTVATAAAAALASSAVKAKVGVL